VVQISSVWFSVYTTWALPCLNYGNLWCYCMVRDLNMHGVYRKRFVIETVHIHPEYELKHIYISRFTAYCMSQNFPPPQTWWCTGNLKSQTSRSEVKVWKLIQAWMRFKQYQCIAVLTFHANWLENSWSCFEFFWSLKTWKVMEFKNFIFQAWKIMEFNCW